MEKSGYPCPCREQFTKEVVFSYFKPFINPILVHEGGFSDESKSKQILSEKGSAQDRAG